MYEKIEDPVKEFLSSYWEMKKESKRLARKIEELTCQCESATARLTGMPRGGSGTVNAAWDALADANTRADENLRDALAREAEIENFIDSVPGAKLRQVLRCRYLELMGWQGIADELGYVERHVRRLHGEALQEARRVWEATHAA